MASPARTIRGNLSERLAALGLLILSSPVLLILMAAVRLLSPGGPVFYRQVRVGQDRRSPNRVPTPPSGVERRVRPGHGRPFQIWKFRTMVPDAEARTGPVWAASEDPRITPIGRFLRKTRLDELPQLLNVLNGEMGLIGPRPERPHFVAQLAEAIPEYRQRLQVRPGITGLAQVSRAYDTDEGDVKKKVQYDVFYIRNRDFRMKLLILTRTVGVVLGRRGAH